MDKKQLLKNDKNKKNVCLATQPNLTHDEKNRYTIICFLLYLNLLLSFLGVYYDDW